MVDDPAGSRLVDRQRRFAESQIEDAAMALFVERGFDAVTVQEIAEAAGTSSRTFFRYFPTKVDVVRGFHRRLLDRLIRAALARPADEDGVRALRAAFLRTAEMGPAQVERVLRIGQVLTGSAGAAARDIAYETRCADELATFVGSRLPGEAEGGVTSRVVAVSMLATAQAVFASWLAAHGERSLTTLLTEAFDVLDAGFGSTRHPSAAASRRPL
ncbi:MULTISPECIES: TetR family transcriptional regulator [Pseudofrankia]|uniref:TetR family transcriptional regulator n=1 Tax=Pseudofrankia TaxID=2994363 RepID=UPI000234B641|nr:MULTISPECIES: TetR family transcriptional regulator [Pseudofrankia]OHV29797.1 hypothetical protein BCD49_35690 [Pseudofrankia sp. EUN1h]